MMEEWKVGMMGRRDEDSRDMVVMKTLHTSIIPILHSFNIPQLSTGGLS